MRRLSVALIAAVSTIALTQVALAADLPVKAPRYAPLPPPPYNWTGFYVGGNVGYSWGNAGSDINADPVTVIDGLSLIPIPGFVGSDSVKPKGIIGGGQIGYNWQFSPNWVAGLEADWQASGEKASHSFTDPFSFIFNAGGGFFIPVTGAAVMDYEAKISWFGTLRGRIGYAWDRVMLYATGGLAYGEIKLAGTNTVSGTVGGAPFLAVTAIGHSKVNAGWTVGAGIEGALVDHWTWKAEYLYMDLGSLDDPDIDLAAISTSGGRVTTHTNFTDNIVRVGLNYRFY
jgi:outer membrane immunogenic protein